MAGEKDNVIVRTLYINVKLSVSEHEAIKNHVLKECGTVANKRVPCVSWLRELALKEVGYIRKGFKERNQENEQNIRSPFNR